MALMLAAERSRLAAVAEAVTVEEQLQRRAVLLAKFQVSPECHVGRLEHREGQRQAHGGGRQGRGVDGAVDVQLFLVTAGPFLDLLRVVEGVLDNDRQQRFDRGRRSEAVVEKRLELSAVALDADRSVVGAQRQVRRGPLAAVERRLQVLRRDQEAGDPRVVVEGAPKLGLDQDATLASVFAFGYPPKHGGHGGLQSLEEVEGVRLEQVRAVDRVLPERIWLQDLDVDFDWLCLDTQVALCRHLQHLQRRKESAALIENVRIHAGHLLGEVAETK